MFSIMVVENDVVIGGHNLTFHVTMQLSVLDSLYHNKISPDVVHRILVRFTMVFPLPVCPTVQHFDPFVLRLVI